MVIAPRSGCTTINQTVKERKKKSKLLSTVLAIFILIGITACFGGYYMVKDPATDKTYYTDKIIEEKGGAIKLKDANTGSSITLQNSEVTKIKKEEFKANTKKD